VSTKPKKIKSKKTPRDLNRSGFVGWVEQRETHQGKRRVDGTVEIRQLNGAHAIHHIDSKRIFGKIANYGAVDEN